MSYPRYREPCGWQALLVQRCPEPALTDELEADLVVVGAGYTGIAAARTWAEARPDDRVALLDASVVGEGSPGRSSGFLLEMALDDAAGQDAVTRVRERNALVGDTMAVLRALVEQHGIRCQLARTGAYWGAAPGQERYLLRCRSALERAGLVCEALDGEALAARIGTRYYARALYSPDCSLVQPAALIRGLADCLPLSVTLFEESPAVALSREGDGWRVECPDGSVKASRVILANDAFARDVAAGVASLGSRLAVLYTYAGLTAPLPRSLLARLGSDPNWGLLPAHRQGTALRRTLDGRLLVRAHAGHQRPADGDAVERRLRECLTRRYPNLPLAGTRFEHVWGGASGFTANGAPVWGEQAPGLWVSAGCNGGGAVTGSLFGALLARRALGEPTIDVCRLFGAASWMPPRPLRQLGRAVRSQVEHLTGLGM